MPDFSGITAWVGAQAVSIRHGNNYHYLPKPVAVSILVCSIWRPNFLFSIQGKNDILVKWNLGEVASTIRKAENPFDPTKLSTSSRQIDRAPNHVA